MTHTHDNGESCNSWHNHAKDFQLTLASVTTAVRAERVLRAVLIFDAPAAKPLERKFRLRAWAKEAIFTRYMNTE